MAIGWLTALKIVPWSDVIEAAPALVSSARKFLNRSQEQSPPSDTQALERQGAPADLHLQVEQLEAAVARLSDRQQASAALIETLAEQNARLVVAVDGLRKRLALAGAVLVLLTMAVGWLAWRQ